MQKVVTEPISQPERSPVEESVLSIARGVSTATGEMFFRSLVEHLVHALRADHAFIGERLDGSERVRTIAVWTQGRIIDNVEYDLADTPCKQVICETMCSHISGVRQAFPHNRFLTEMEVEGYVGTPLFDSSGAVLGLMVVLFGQAVESLPLAESILQIFAVRAGAELERRRAEKAFRRSEERWRRVYEHSPFGIALTNADGRFLAANRAYQRMLGYSEEELRGLSWPELTHEDDREENLALCRKFENGPDQLMQVEKRYRRKDGEILWVSNTVNRVAANEDCAGFVMALVEDITERKRLQDSLEEKHERLRLLLSLTNNVLSHLDLRQLCQAVSSSIRRVMQCDLVGLTLPDLQAGGMRLYTLDFPDGKGVVREGDVFPMEGTPSGLTFRSGQLHVFDAKGMAQFDPGINPGLAEGLQSGCFLPLIHRARVLGTLNLCRLTDSRFAEAEIDFLVQVASQVAIAVDNALNFRELSEARERLAEEKRCLEDEIRSERNFSEIIGDSPVLAKVLRQVEIVATTDATVLIYGETGTGKELIARAIHDLSARSAHPFVKVNCAAIPRELLESELFGHEKGAFTGAIARRIGRFELAHEGTLFLDEIGEMPLDLQPKLLRVLQEQEFERLGGARTVKTDVRLVAATNRDLSEMVRAQQFRDDLYYRLNVFPVTVPPLRERKEDIESLVPHFVEHYARRNGRSVSRIPEEVMDALRHYPWPGNVRELQNVIERAVILSTDGVLRVPLSEAGQLNSQTAEAPQSAATLEDMERAYILQTLRETGWVVGGPKGAAGRLGLKRSTLRSRMEKLGIFREG